MDEGTDAREILENKLLPLRRGENVHLPVFFVIQKVVWIRVVVDSPGGKLKVMLDLMIFLALIIVYSADIKGGCAKSILQVK